MSDENLNSSLDDRGWHRDARRVRSPNRDARPDGDEVSLVVIHNISLPPGQFDGDAIEALFLDQLDTSAHPFFLQLAQIRVSAHFLIRRDGGLIQFVSCLERAWHAGQSVWRGRERCNDFSIGIELEGTDQLLYADAQYEQLIALSISLCTRYPIVDIVGHAHIAPTRKTDPGPAFDWDRYLERLGSLPRKRMR